MNCNLRRGASLVLLCLLSSAAAAADPDPGRGPVPAWVQPTAIPSPDPAHKDAAVQILMLASQTRFDKSGEKTFFEMVIRPQTIAGLQSSGTLAIPWNVARSDLTINAVEIRRAGKVIDLLKDAEFTVLRRENNLERSTLDGLRTVVLPTKGLQVGDDIRLAATYSRRADVKTGAPEHLDKWEAPFPVGLLTSRILVADGLDVRWRAGGRAPKPTIAKSADVTEYHFIQSKLPKAEYPSSMRAVDKDNDVQFTTYRDWGQVAAETLPLYEKARKVGPSSDLIAEADKIAAASPDPRRRMLAALRLVQERMRYVALLLGEGAYTPVNADEAWEVKFGDCKAKTATLLALLDRLGIDAAPMYTSSETSSLLGDRLPSLQTFDHVIVKAMIGDTPYYLDGTDFGQRTLADVAGSRHRYGLPIKTGATLEKIPRLPTSAPIIENTVIWDGSRGVLGDVPFTVRLVLRGVKAVEARAKKQSAETPEAFETYLKELVPGIANNSLKIVSQQDDESTGEYVIALSGAADLDWDEYQDRKGNRFAFTNSVSKWSADFERDKGDFKDVPVELNPNFWERETEVLILPTAKGYRVDDPAPIDVVIAGSKISRTVSMVENRVTAVTDFRHLEEFISAEEARKAEPELAKISANWAFVVAPRSLKVPKEKD